MPASIPGVRASQFKVSLCISNDGTETLNWLNLCFHGLVNIVTNAKWTMHKCLYIALRKDLISIQKTKRATLKTRNLSREW